MVYDLSDCDSNRKIKKSTYHLWLQNQSNILSTYRIATYEKEMMCFDEPFLTRQYRSVIFSYPENQLQSLSPPRSLSIETFFEEYSAIDQNIQINELIEGNLIHLFYDDRKASWEIATKNAVGGNYRFLCKNGNKEKQKCVETVRNMFLESLGLIRKTEFDKIPGFDSLPKEYSYCFVLQNQENTIMMSNLKPTLYLVSVYDVLREDKLAKLIPQGEYEMWKCFRDLPKIQFPRMYQFLNYADCADSLRETRANYSIMGYNIANLVTGERCIVVNELYKNVYLMKGEPDDILYLYLCLRRIRKTKEFLSHFPKYKKTFSKFYEQYGEFIKNIHLAYLEKWVYKKSVHQKYTRYIDRLHREIYLPSLSTLCPEKITKSKIFDFFGSLEPDEVFYFMNYDRRAFSQGISTPAASLNQFANRQ